MPRTPAEIAHRLAKTVKRSDETQPPADIDNPWSRETFRLPRAQAGETARAWFDRYPEAAYRTRIESWRLLDKVSSSSPCAACRARAEGAEIGIVTSPPSSPVLAGAAQHKAAW